MSVPEYMDYNTIRQESSECYQTRIRHATVDRLLDRLTDLRFLSIDFLNTFLLTYRVFTTGITVLEALKKVYKNPDCCGNLDSSLSSVSGQSMTDQDIFSESPPNQTVQFTVSPPDNKLLIRPQPNGRRISTGCMKNEITGDTSNAERLVSTPSIFHRFERGESTESDDSRPDLSICLVPPKPKLAPIASCETLYDHEIPDIEIPAITTTEIFPNLMLPDESDEPFTNVYEDYEKEGKLLPPTISGFGSSSETLTEPLTPPLLSSAPSSDTLTPGSPIASPMSSPMSGFKKTEFISSSQPSTPVKTTNSLDSTSHSPMSSPTKGHIFKGPSPPIRIPMRSTSPRRATSPSFRPTSKSPTNSPKPRRAPSPVFGYSYSSPNMIISQVKNRPFSGKRGSAEAESISTPRSSFTQIEGSPPKAKAGTVVTSSRQSKRRSSSSAATTAFAAATAGSANPADHTKGVCRYLSAGAADNKFQKKRESVISTAATMRVLNVLKHWVSKHQQDFESGHQLKAAVIDLLEEMVCNTTLLPAEHKAAGGILRTITMENTDTNQVDLEKLLVPPATSSKDTFDSLSALDIAEQLTYLDHKIFVAIRSEELLSQAWMKPDKENKAPHVLLVSKRFNEVSRLVVSEIVSRSNLQDRVSCIEKWAAIADICRCMHNYNGVLQICAAFVNSSVYRLKKTWERLSKQTKQMIERLQTLVSSEGRFKNMRDALHRCDPPCIPYLGMYLTDLSFIEEGTPNFTEDKLVNFSKMRMIAHVIREIRLFQQTPYRIEHHSRITNYLLDLSRLLLEDQAYKASLEIEPKQSRLSVVTPP